MAQPASSIDPRVRRAFAELAAAAFDYRARFPRQHKPTWWRLLTDPGLVAIHDSGLSLNLDANREVPRWQAITETLWNSYPFEHFAPGGELEPGIRSAAGGGRLPPGGIFQALIGPAFAKLYVTQVPPERTAFVEQALRSLEDLDGALNGRPVEALVVTGVAGMRLPAGVGIATPWGTLRSLPDVDPASMFMYDHRDPATCSLTDVRYISMKVDRDREWNDAFDSGEISVEVARTLLPVAAALASKHVEDARGPTLTWTTVVPSISFGFGSSHPLMQTKSWGPFLELDPGQLIDWSRTVGAEHRPSVDVAARRLANALSYRWEKADVLIDSVTVWENLVGAGSEVSFRVTAALAKILESDPDRRLSLMRRLREIYGIRSRIVHGAVVKSSEIDAAAAEAVSVCVRALKVFYRRGAKWLEKESHERATAILVTEP